MKKNKRTIAVATWVGDTSLNYGSALQTVAMQRLLLDCDCKPITIRNHFDYSGKYDELKKSMYKGLSYMKAKRSFEKWFKKNARISKKCFCTEDVIDYVFDRCDILLSGSDAIWNQKWASPLFLWDFEKLQDKPRMAYAPSIQSGEVTYANMRAALERYSFISGRESKVKELLLPYTDKEIFIVLDPTLAVEEEFWKRRSARPLIKERYICCYILSKIEYHWISIEKIKKKYNADRIVFINTDNIDGKVGWQSGYRMNDYKKNVGPAEFISLIKNAVAVCTDSFHGVCFSIIFRKEFYVFERVKQFALENEYRFNDLFRRLGIGNRIMANNRDIDLAEEIDWKLVEDRLKGERENSICYLKNAIKSISKKGMI